MGLQAFRAELAVECFDEPVVRGFTERWEVQRDVVGVGPKCIVNRPGFTGEFLVQ